MAGGNLGTLHMGMLIEGTWVVDDLKYRNAPTGQFERADSSFRDSVTAEGSGKFPAVAGRYQLLTAVNCPWAHRTVIARRLKGLEGAIDLLVASDPQTDQGWPFNVGVGKGPQPRDGVLHLHEVYTAADPTYSGRVTVPTLWDREFRTIVNNESADILRMLNTQFSSVANSSFDLRPHALRERIDAVNEWVYRDINNGVYRCGFAQTQAAYEQACQALFDALDRAEAVLDRSRFLAGPALTEADVRLFPTLVRFDAVYYGLFKCNMRRLQDYPNLSGYVRDLYARPGFGDTCDIDAFKRGYYAGIKRANPNGIIPLGPLGLDAAFEGPHDRDARTYQDGG
jgi:putative glutathione S-transferase